MEAAKHTPTPWSAPAWAAKDGRYGIYGAKHATVGKAPLAFVKGDKRVTGGDGAANAAFIVRAVNSHEQLVAALRCALAVIDDYLNYEHNGDPWTEDARAMGEMDIDDYERDGRLENARAALAAAEA